MRNLACPGRRPIALIGGPGGQLIHRRCERLGGARRDDCAVHTAPDEGGGGGNPVRRDPGQSVAQALMHDESPWLVEGGNDERIDLRVEGGKVLAGDVAEEPYATALRRRSDRGLAERPVACNPQLAARETGECL